MRRRRLGRLWRQPRGILLPLPIQRLRGSCVLRPRCVLRVYKRRAPWEGASWWNAARSICRIWSGIEGARIIGSRSRGELPRTRRGISSCTRMPLWEIFGVWITHRRALLLIGSRIIRLGLLVPIVGPARSRRVRCAVCHGGALIRRILRERRRVRLIITVTARSNRKVARTLALRAVYRRTWRSGHGVPPIVR